MGWFRRLNEVTLDALIARVDAHVPDASGRCAGRQCKYQFNGTPEDTRRHQLKIAYLWGRG